MSFMKTMIKVRSKTTKNVSQLAIYVSYEDWFGEHNLILE